MATTKMVYFVIDGRNECAEFSGEDSCEEVREIFRAAAEAGPDDILKLYNSRGNIVNISPKLAVNSADHCYRLDVVAAYCDGSITPVASKIGFDIGSIEHRLEMLEREVFTENGNIPQSVQEMKRKVELFRLKLENVEHLSWLGLFKDISSGTSLQPFWDKRCSLRKSDEQNKSTYEKFIKISHVQVTDEVRDYLRKPTFDNWQWDDPEMMVLLRQMFIDLDFINKFKIEMPVLHQWLYEVYKNYNQVPFHNFKHCFMVTQMMYGLTWLIGLSSYLSDIDILTLITSSICHDLDHPGYNNAYQINARTKLALRYNDISPLENHHCSIAFEILEKNDCNLFRNLGSNQYKDLREGMIRCILATDMAKHSDILSNFKAATPEFDFSNKEHKALLMIILIKVADISNEARPMEVAEPWLECLLQEFFNQSDLEKLEGLPVAPFMDREKVTKCSSQIGFIKFVLLPLFESLGQLFPVVDDHIIEPVRTALNYYQKMQDALDDEKQRKEMTNGHSKQTNKPTRLNNSNQKNGKIKT